jgi:hypothetical protein
MPLTFVTDERHLEQVKSVLDRISSVSFTAVATEVAISPTSVYCILTKSLGKQKVSIKWIPLCSTTTTEPCVFFLPPPICSLEKGRQCIY